MDRLGQAYGEDRPVAQVLLERLLLERPLLEFHPLVPAEAAVVPLRLSHGTIFGDSAETLFKRDTSPSQGSF